MSGTRYHPSALLEFLRGMTGEPAAPVPDDEPAPDGPTADPYVPDWAEPVYRRHGGSKR